MTNKRSLYDCTGIEEQSKVVLLLPGSGLPLLDLGGSNPGANKLAPLLGTNLKILPRKNDKDLDLAIDGEQSVRHQEG